MRSIAAASSAANRQYDKIHTACVSPEETEDTQSFVEAWEDYLADITTVHVDIEDAIDWNDLQALAKPKSPELKAENQKQVQDKINKFSPKVTDLFKGGADKRKAELYDELKASISKDQAALRRAKIKHKKDVAEWEKEIDFAARLIEGDVAATKEVIEELQTVMDQEMIGTDISFHITKDCVHAMPEILGEEIAPNFRRKKTVSHKLAKSEMPEDEFNELHKGYVASVALRVAGDLFNILPNDTIYVTCVTPRRSAKTGLKKNIPILSAKFDKEAFKELGAENIDPSSSLEMFKHVMKFDRETGFDAVKPLQKTS